MDLNRLRLLFNTESTEEFEDFDLSEEAERMELVEHFAPLPSDAAQRDVQMAFRTVAVTQILNDDPPETWQTVNRCLEAGLDAQTVLGQLAVVVSEHLGQSMAAKTPFDVAAYTEALAQLPLPTGAHIADCLVQLVADEPGILADELGRKALDRLGLQSSLMSESLVDQVFDRLLGQVLHLLPGDLTVAVPALVDGATFTHRFNEAEANLGSLSIGFDLGAFANFDTVRLGDGTELDQFSVEQFHLGWAGPDGWLDDFNPGDLLTFTVSVDPMTDPFIDPLEATLAIEVVDDEPNRSGELVAHVRAAYDELVEEPGLPVAGDALAYHLLFHHPDLFANAQPPLGEMVVAAELEQRGGQVAHSEEIWGNELRVDRFRQIFHLVDEERWRKILISAVNALTDPESPVDAVQSALDDCAEPETLDVLADVLFGHYLDRSDAYELERSDSPGHLFELVDRAVALARKPRQIATANYLACVLYERSADPEEAEIHLRRAGEARHRLGPIVERLGWYRFDRGDAAGAMKWWRELSGDHEAARTIKPFLNPTSGRPKVGRNDPCWCGSGRKFKQCHRNVSDLPPLPDRVGWLCRKAALWVEHCGDEVRGTVTELALAYAAGNPHPEELESADVDPAALRRAFEDPLVMDTALHEGRHFNLFLRERGPLLPEDEQLLAASWLTVDRSVHEVMTVDKGEGLTLRNLATGDVVDVQERSASTQVKVGELYCARVVPDGASHQIIGGVFPVGAGQESAVLDLCAKGDPVTICAWAGALHRPPQIVHKPGMAEEMFDREAIEDLLADFDEDADSDEMAAVLQAELQRQAQARWLDESVPALGGLTPREAAADPTRRPQLERLLIEFEDRTEAGKYLPEGFTPFSYDVPELRRELGLL